jgi:4-carboxymuconolactone decarboxylase
MTDEAAFDRGLARRRSVLGDEYVDAAFAKSATSPFGDGWQRFVTEHCWDAAWNDDRLPPATRSLLTISLLAALGRTQELAAHLRGARNNGCTIDEVSAALTHAAVYAGMPAGVEGFRVAAEVWE